MSSRSALFVIDVQNALATALATRIPNAERLKSVLKEVLQVVRGLPSNNPEEAPIIVFVQHSQPPEDGALVRGTKPWDLVFDPEPNNVNEFVIHKTTGDAFLSNPELASTLSKRGVTQIITLGIQSECCVQATALGALAAGFQVTILEDAHSTYNASDATAIEIEKEVEELIVSRGGKSIPYKAALKRWTASGKVV